MPLDLTALPTITRERDDQEASLVINCKDCHRTTAIAWIIPRTLKTPTFAVMFAANVLAAAQRGDQIAVAYSSEPIALNGCECKEKTK
jgi:hypothetical protein